MGIFFCIIGVIILYILLTGKKRRERIFTSIIKNMILNNIEDTEHETIYYDAAEKYALEHGAKINPHTPNFISFEESYFDTRYIIYFSKTLSRGTHITVKDYNAEMTAFENKYFKNNH